MVSGYGRGTANRRNTRINISRRIVITFPCKGPGRGPVSLKSFHLYAIIAYIIIPPYILIMFCGVLRVLRVAGTGTEDYLTTWDKSQHHSLHHTAVHLLSCESHMPCQYNLCSAE